MAPKTSGKTNPAPIAENKPEESKEVSQETSKPETETSQIPEQPKVPEKTVIRQWAEKNLSPEKLKMAEQVGFPVGFFIDYMDAMEKAVKEDRAALIQLGTNIKPVIEFAQKVNAAQAQGQGGGQSKGGLGIMDIVSAVKELGGTSTSPLQAKFEEAMIKLMDRAIDNSLNPQKSKFDIFFEEEIARAKAKAMAAAMTQ